MRIKWLPLIAVALTMLLILPKLFLISNTGSYLPSPEHIALNSEERQLNSLDAHSIDRIEVIDFSGFVAIIPYGQKVKTSPYRRSSIHNDTAPQN